MMEEAIKSIRACIDSSNGTSCDVAYIERSIESCIASCGDFPHCAEEKVVWETALAHVRAAWDALDQAQRVLHR